MKNKQDSMKDYLDLNYGYVFKNKDLFSIENLKRYNTLKAFESKVSSYSSEAEVYMEATAHFSEMRGLKIQQTNINTLATKIIEELEQLNLSHHLKSRFIYDLKKLSEKKYTEEEIFKVIDDHLSNISPQIVSNVDAATYYKESVKMDYMIARSAYYLIMSLPVVIPIAYFGFMK